MRENTPIRRTRVAAPSDEALMSDNEIGQGQTRVMKSTGDASESLSDNVIERVTEFGVDEEHAAMMKFLSEPVTIKIPTSTDPNAEQVFEIIVNGRTELFRRGETKTVPRYYADHMLRMKETRYKSQEVMTRAGDRDVVYEPSTALKYDFQIVRDANPASESWYKSVLAEQG